MIHLPGVVIIQLGRWSSHKQHQCRASKTALLRICGHRAVGTLDRKLLCSGFEGPVLLHRGSRFLLDFEVQLRFSPQNWKKSFSPD